MPAGYSDMVAQRGDDVGTLAPRDKPQVLVAAKSAKGARPMRDAAEPRKRLSFAEQHALKTSPARINGLNAEIKRLELCLPIQISIQATARRLPPRVRRSQRFSPSSPRQRKSGSGSSFCARK